MKKYNKIFIASDHGGVKTKDVLINHFSKEYEIIDLGTNSDDSVDYPIYAKKLCKEVLANKNSFGILICGTGIGMCIAANKIKNIRCANVTNSEFAKLSKQHNNANVLSLSGRFVSDKENIKIVESYLECDFEDRHQKRLDMLEE